MKANYISVLLVILICHQIYAINFNLASILSPWTSQYDLDSVPSGIIFKFLVDIVRDAGEKLFGPPPYSIRSEKIPYTVYDYIVIGGGTSGSVIAKRLSENPEVSVLVIEAGGEESGLSATPAAWFLNINSKRDYKFRSVPQKHAAFGLNKRQVACTQGKVIGGGSSINWEMYTRGVMEDYDRWEKLGAKNWGYSDIFPYFIKSEGLEPDPLVDPGFHGTKGPMNVIRTEPNFKFETQILKGEEKLGQVLGDYNGAKRVGLYNQFQVFVQNGSRVSTARAYLANNPGNLDIILHAFATKIIFHETDSGPEVYAVEYIKSGIKRVVKVRKEIILCAGVYNTPKLLMLSGIGPGHQLKKHGISVISDLPGVGQNLQEHVFTFLNFKISPLFGYTLSPQVLSGSFIAQYVANKTGPLATIGATAITFFRTKFAKDERPDFQLEQYLLTAFPNLFNLKDKVFNNLVFPHITSDLVLMLLNLIRPLSKGYVKLRSSDPLAPPLIDPRFLSHPNDAKTLAEFGRITVELFETPIIKTTLKPVLLDNLIGCEHLPRQSFEFFECYARHITFSQLHGCCTAKIGHEEDKMAVVDEQLRVRGVHGLRIGDTSVWPEIISGNPAVTVIAVAERLADLIRGRVLKSFKPPYIDEKDVFQYIKLDKD